MAIKLRSDLYKDAGKDDISSAYSAGNYSLSTLVQAVLPYSSSGMTTTDQANLVISCSNGNLSGEDIWAGTPQTGYPTSQNISMGALAPFSGSTTEGAGWGNNSGSFPTMTFKYVPYGWAYTGGDLYAECTTKIVDEVNYHSINIENALPEQSSSQGLDLLNTASLEAQMEFGGLIVGEGTSTSNAYFNPILGNNQVVPPHSGSFKIPQVVTTNSNVNYSQSVVFAFWLKQRTLQNYDTFIWANDQDKSNTSWDSSGYACELLSDGKLKFYRGLTTTGGLASQIAFTTNDEITEDAWNFIFCRLTATNNTVNPSANENDCWIYKPNARGTYAWVHTSFATPSGANPPVGYSSTGTFIFHPPFTHPSDAEIGHFYMFWETRTQARGGRGRVSEDQMEQMVWVTDSGSYQLYTS